MKLAFRSKIWLPLALAASVSACATSRDIGGDPNLQVLPTAEMPPPGPSDISRPGGLYSIGPYDKLTIDVLGMPELSIKEVLVDANGSISVPLAGPVLVTGMTSAQVEQFIVSRLREKYVLDPKVTVNLIQSVSHAVTIDGEVRRPGSYPVAGGMTLMKSVALAEGATDDARLSDVVVFRTVEGQRYAALYNLAAIRRGGSPDPAIYANDIIMVGDAASKRLFKDLLTAVPAILTPIVILLTQN
jgi:polysaccharide export outer membrane protein